MKKAKVNLKNIIAYIQGNVRYTLFYSPFNFLIPRYIKEQIQCRISSMRKVCYEQGYCEECGCKTTHLQMANKSCDGKCYPRMLNKSDWRYLKIKGIFKDKKENRVWRFEEGKFL